MVNFGHDLEKRNRGIIGLLLDCACYKNLIQTEAESRPGFLDGTLVAATWYKRAWNIMLYRKKKNLSSQVYSN